MNALLYREIDAGRGDAELEDRIPFSGVCCIGLRAATGTEVGNELRSEGNPREEGAFERGETPSGGSNKDGEADNGGALKGWNDTEGLRAGTASPPRAAPRAPAAIFMADGGF